MKDSDMDKIVKEVKQEIYNAHFAYVKNINYEKAYQKLKEAYESGEEQKIMDVHRQLLKVYDSKRLEIIDDFYRKIFEVTGEPRVILDMACGLNPLAIPWMSLKDVDYYCYDIESKEIDFLNKYLKLLGFKELAFWQDVISKTPTQKADVAFLLKSITCFEWQEKGSGLKVIEKLSAKYIVVSIPITSAKIIDSYEEYFYKIIGNQNWDITKIVFEKELVFIIRK